MWLTNYKKLYFLGLWNLIWNLVRFFFKQFDVNFVVDIMLIYFIDWGYIKYFTVNVALPAV